MRCLAFTFHLSLHSGVVDVWLFHGQTGLATCQFARYSKHSDLIISWKKGFAMSDCLAFRFNHLMVNGFVAHGFARGSWHSRDIGLI